MRRVLATLAAAALLTAPGCGGRSYEVRLEKTLEDMKYKKRLDDNLIAPPKGKFETYMIFIRPPKLLQGPTKEFQLTTLEPGRFELAESFFEKDKQNLHVLARVKPLKAAAKKKATPKPEDAVVRGDFNTDVVAILNNVYGLELDLAKAKEESKGRNNVKNVYKHLTFPANDKIVQLYLYGKKDPKDPTPNVALIFEYSKAEQASLVSKIELCLECFATGERAKRSFNGAVTEEEQAEGGTTAAPVF